MSPITRRRMIAMSLASLAVVQGVAATFAQGDTPLASWQKGPTRDRIIAFVEASLKEGESGYIVDMYDLARHPVS